MRHTKYTTKLPTRATFRDAATALRNATDRHRENAGDYAASAAVACVAAAAFVAGAMGVGLALGAALTALPGRQFTMLAATATALVALHAVPLLALFAADLALRALETRE